MIKDYKPYGVGADEPAVLNPMFEGYRYHFTGLAPLDQQDIPTEDVDTCDALMKKTI